MDIRKGPISAALSVWLVAVVLGSLAGEAWGFIPLGDAPAWESITGYVSTGGAFADIDGDRDLDLVVSNGNDIQRQRDHVYFNIAGSLETAPSWTSDDTEYGGHLAVGDVDGDGDLDLAVAGLGSTSSFAVDDLYYNTGTGLEGTPSWHPVDLDNSFGIAWGDMDLDGDLDLAVASGLPYTHALQSTRVYLNNDGLLDSLAVWASPPGYGADVAWGDVDGDGDLDLAVAHDSLPNQIYMNEGGMLEPTPSWSSTETLWTLRLAWGDVDGDDDLDLAVANNAQLGGESNCQVYYNVDGELETSAGWTSREIRNYYSCVAWGDVDGDGDLDLAAGGWWEPVVVFENLDGVLDSLATWSWIPGLSSYLVCEAVVWGDVDEDGLVSVGGELHDGDGVRQLYYLEHAPVHELQCVVVGGRIVGPSGYCCDLRSGWILFREPPPAASGIVSFDYAYSVDMELAVTNWATGRGNFLFLNTNVTSVEDRDAGSPEMIAMPILLQNRPNPFSTTTAIGFSVPARGEGSVGAGKEVEIVIYNATGQRIKTLVSGELEPGRHQVIWDGRIEQGTSAASGVYFCRLTLGGMTATRSMVMVR